MLPRYVQAGRGAQVVARGLSSTEPGVQGHPCDSLLLSKGVEPSLVSLGQVRQGRAIDHGSRRIAGATLQSKALKRVERSPSFFYSFVPSVQAVWNLSCDALLLRLYALEKSACHSLAPLGPIVNDVGARSHS